MSMWIMKIEKNNFNNFRFYIAPYDIILKYIKDNYINIDKKDDYNFIAYDNINNIYKISIHLGEKLYVKQKDGTLYNRQYRQNRC